MVTLNSAALDLVLHQLYVHFPVPGGLVRAVDGVDICFRHQQITGIIGESGCGKSVLGQAILGILPDYVARSGNIFYRSTDILADNTSLPGFYGQQIALIPQNPGDSLNPLRTIGRQFDDILQTAGFNDKTNQRKQQLLTFFGLPDAERVLAAYPHELSGGMLQRVLCAMSICCSPLWLLADEPTKGLDETACGVVYENLQKIKTSQSLGMLIITHDLQLARSICADIAVMYAVLALLMAGVGGIFFGSICAVYRGSFFDNFVKNLTNIMLSIPGFWLALILILIFSEQLRWLPTSGTGSLKYFLLPAFVLAFATMATVCRFMRGALLTEFGRQYFLVAKVRGINKFNLLTRYALPNAIIPVIALLGNYFASVLGGSVIAESIFAIPGISSMALEAIRYRDYPVLQAYVLVSGCTLILVMVTVDLLIAYLNPKVKLGERS